MKGPLVLIWVVIIAFIGYSAWFANLA